jgi:hypothetical protein
MSKTELVPCPFCGSRDIAYFYPVAFECQSCQARGPHNPVADDATWNKRSYAHVAAEVVAELRDKTREVGRRLVADYPASEYHTGEAYAYDAAAHLVAEKLGVKS